MKKIDNSYWSIERWRFALILFFAFLGGLVSGFWKESLIIALVAYIAWLLFKLQQLHSWLEHGAKPKQVPDNNGIWERIVYHIQSTQKKSDRRKKRMAKLLKRTQGIITGLPYATVVLNGNNEIDWANRNSIEYLNVDSKKDRGWRIDNLVRVPEFQQALKQDKSDEIEIALPHNPHRKLAVQIIPVQNNLKLLVARDISERVNIQQMRKNFIANASHELRTPLTVIAGYLEIMRGDDTFPEPLKPAVESASEQSARMQRIIEDLLTLSRLENSELNDDSSSEIDMPGIVESICNDEVALLAEEDHTLSVRVDPDLFLKGSEAEIVSVCSNLIHNAVRHTQPGTHVDVEWKALRNGEACLKVSDNGQGIAGEHLIHLTERFYRVDKGRSRDKGGTGLGLAIVQHVIQRHGGKLNIDSAVGKGSTFSACFPARRVVRKTENGALPKKQTA